VHFVSSFGSAYLRVFTNVLLLSFRLLGFLGLHVFVELLLFMRKKHDVPSMWGNIHPQWRLLQQHLGNQGALVGTRLQKEKSGQKPTGPIGLEMI